MKKSKTIKPASVQIIEQGLTLFKFEQFFSFLPIHPKVRFQIALAIIWLVLAPYAFGAANEAPWGVLILVELVRLGKDTDYGKEAFRA